MSREAAPQVPLRLGAPTRPAYETLLWRLADHGLCPRFCPSSTWCEDDKPLVPDGCADFFSGLPADLDPAAFREAGRGPLPPERAHRKQCQIVAIVKLVQTLLDRPAADRASAHRRPLIVDFCGGSGHLGLVLAAQFPDVDVLVVDFCAFKLEIGEARAATMSLHNFSTLAADIGSFVAPREGGSFDIGIALHACGSATDLALASCSRVGASFVVSPCCVGKIAEYRAKASNKGQKALAEQTRICDGRVTGLQMPRSALFGSVIDTQEYLSLASAADYHSEKAPSPQHQSAKLFVELDRLARITEEPQMRYRVRLGKLPKSARSPKDDVLWGWSAAKCSETRDVYLRSLWKESRVSEALVLGGYWLHEGVDEAALPLESSLLSPAADDASVQLVVQLVQQVVASRDRGDGLQESCVPITSTSLAAVSSAGPSRAEGTEARVSNKDLRRLKFEQAAAGKVQRMKQRPHQSPVASNASAAEPCRAFGQQPAGFDAREGGTAAAVMCVPAPVWCLHPSCVFQGKQWPSKEALEQHRSSAHSTKRAANRTDQQEQRTTAAVVGTPNARGDRRLFQEVAHALCVSCFALDSKASAQMYIAAPPHWPLLLDRSLQLAGAALERAVAPYTHLIPTSRRRSLTARRVQLGHRMELVSEVELQQLWGKCGTDAARRGLMDDALLALGGFVDQIQVVKLGAECLMRKVCAVESVHLSGEMAVTAHPQVTDSAEADNAEDVDLDRVVSGAIRKRNHAILFTIAVRWPQASAWRRGLGLDMGSSGQNSECATFAVELGI